MLPTYTLYHALLIRKSEDVSRLTTAEIRSGEAASTRVQRISLFLSRGFHRSLAICRAQQGIVTCRRYTSFVLIVSGLELQWLFTGWDVFATRLDMFVHVLATHDTSCKWLFAQLAVVGCANNSAFMSQRFLRCVKVPNNAFASSFILKSEKPQPKRINYCSKHTLKMQWVVHKCLTGSVDLKRVELPLKATPARDDRQHRETRK